MDKRKFERQNTIFPKNTTDPLLIKERKTVRHTRFPNEEQAKAICQGMSFALKFIYPGYMWEVGLEQDMVYIRLPLVNSRMAFRARLDQFDVEGKFLMRAGGEILERYGLSRDRGDIDAVRALPRDVKRDAIGDHS